MSAYWVSAYREIRDPERVAAYAALAGPAIEAAGGRFIARAPAARAFEDGVLERTVIVEFPDLETALATYDSPAYREALDALGDAVVRDLRVVDGVS